MQTDRKTHRHKDRHTDRQTNRQTDIIKGFWVSYRVNIKFGTGHILYHK